MVRQVHRSRRSRPGCGRSRPTSSCSRRSSAARRQSLAQTLGMQHHWALKHYPWTPLLKSKAEGLAILTPHTLSATGSASLPPNRSHWSYKRRIVVWGLVERPDHSAYRVYDAHLIGGDAADDRLDQARRVAALVVEHGGAPVGRRRRLQRFGTSPPSSTRSPASKGRQPPRRTRPTRRGSGSTTSSSPTRRPTSP